MSPDFTFRDGERLIRLGEGALAEAPALLAERGFDGYALLCTERSRTVAPQVVAGAGAVLDVPTGPVPELATALVEPAAERPVVALGGGRVVDVAKAVSAVRGTEAAAIPTTLAGSSFTPFHRLPPAARTQMHRPSLAICDPELMVPGDRALRTATAMNSMAHAMEALYAPLANPVTEEAALRAAADLSHGLEDGSAPDLAEGAFLAGYAVGNTGLCVHHAVCQTVVATAGTPHALTNAVMLPHSARLMERRVSLSAFADRLGDTDDPARALARLAAPAGATRLSELGVSEDQLAQVVAGVLEHPGLTATPDPPGEDELLDLLRAAL